MSIRLFVEKNGDKEFVCYIKNVTKNLFFYIKNVTKNFFYIKRVTVYKNSGK